LEVFRDKDVSEIIEVGVEQGIHFFISVIEGYLQRLSQDRENYAHFLFKGLWVSPIITITV